MQAKSNPKYIQLRNHTDKQLLDRIEDLEQVIESINSHEFLTSDWLIELIEIDHELDARELAMQDAISALKEVY